PQGQPQPSPYHVSQPLRQTRHSPRRRRPRHRRSRRPPLRFRGLPRRPPRPHRNQTPNNDPGHRSRPRPQHRRILPHGPPPRGLRPRQLHLHPRRPGSRRGASLQCGSPPRKRPLDPRYVVGGIRELHQI
ncbi:hypothetical protein LTR94_018194, partial [Friedmanniomyces endolithicus]